MVLVKWSSSLSHAGAMALFCGFLFGAVDRLSSADLFVENTGKYSVSLIYRPASQRSAGPETFKAVRIAAGTDDPVKISSLAAIRTTSRCATLRTTASRPCLPLSEAKLTWKAWRSAWLAAHLTLRWQWPAQTARR